MKETVLNIFSFDNLNLFRISDFRFRTSFSIFNLLFFFATPACFATGADSLLNKKVTPKIKFFTEDMVTDSIQTSLLDTSLEISENFGLPEGWKNNSGNLGTAHHNLIFNPLLDEIDDIGFHQFGYYAFHPLKVKYYYTNKQFTELSYMMGTRKEQLLKLGYTQSISPQLNIGIDFRKINSDGFYQRQETNNSNFDVFSWYHTKNERYKLLTNFIYNNFLIHENGGMANDASFENGNINDPKTITLEQAETRWKEKIVYAKQFFDVGFKIKNKEIPQDTSKEETSVQDTSKQDTLNPKSQIPNPKSQFKFFPTQRFSHTVWISEKSTVYQDLDIPSFYRYDSLQTFDSTYYTKMSNEFSWTTLKWKKHSQKEVSDTAKTDTTQDRTHRIFFTVHHHFLHYRQRDIDSILNNVVIKGGIESTDTTKWLRWGVKGFYNVHGTSFKDYRFSLFSNVPINFKGDFFLADVVFQKQSPDLIKYIYHANQFYWTNNLQQMDINSASITYVATRWHLSVVAKSMLISNYVYWDNYALPQQYEPRINLFSLSLNKDFHWHKFAFTNNITYQYASLDVIRVPDIITYQSIYYENSIFKKAMLARIGLSCRYNTLYYADAYMPATGQFYFQTTKEIGNYPVLDFFVSAKIKTARIFFRIEHLNDGLLDISNAYILPHYPLPGRALKFGISWRFFDF